MPIILFEITGVETATGKEYTFEEQGTCFSDVQAFMRRSYPWLNVTSITEMA